LSSGAIAGVVVAGIFAAVLLIAVVVRIVRRWGEKKLVGAKDGVRKQGEMEDESLVDGQEERNEERQS